MIVASSFAVDGRRRSNGASTLSHSLDYSTYCTTFRFLESKSSGEEEKTEKNSSRLLLENVSSDVPAR